MKLLFENNPAYNKYEIGLIQLHQLLAEGKNDTPEIEPIHEELDDCVPYLNSAEVQRLRGLSADLYMIEGKEIFEKTDLTPEEVKERCAEASRQEDWEGVLALLRTGKIVSSAPELAALRARLYALLGHAEASRRFQLYAEKYAVQRAIAGFTAKRAPAKRRKTQTAETVSA